MITQRQLAKNINRAETLVRKYARELGYKAPYTNEQAAEIAALSETRPRRNMWTAQLDHRLLALARGRSIRQAAAALGVSRQSAAYRIKKIGRNSKELIDGTAYLKVSDLRKQVPTILSIVSNGLIELVARGNEKGRKGERRLIMLKDFLAFLQDERYFMLWEPERLEDVLLRAQMIAYRSSFGWRWLTSREIQERDSVGSDGFMRRVMSGCYKSAFQPYGWHGDWYVKSNDFGTITGKRVTFAELLRNSPYRSHPTVIKHIRKVGAVRGRDKCFSEEDANKVMASMRAAAQDSKPYPTHPMKGKKRHQRKARAEDVQGN